MRHATTLLISLFGIALALTGCNIMKPQQFAQNTPKLVLEEYFLGHTRGWGIFEDRFGNLRRQFVVDIEGYWQDGKFVLDEKFAYSDGEKDTRTWVIGKLADNRYEGRADDVVGLATGESAGNALNWRYDLDLKVGERTWRVHFDDWLILQPDGILMNRARVSKWGVAIGEVTLVFQRWPSAKQAAGAMPAPDTSFRLLSAGGWL